MSSRGELRAERNFYALVFVGVALFVLLLVVGFVEGAFAALGVCFGGAGVIALRFSGAVRTHSKQHELLLLPGPDQGNPRVTRRVGVGLLFAAVVALYVAWESSGMGASAP
ncbi:MAG: hypothetical protein KIT72_09240 [Polyangiaceae bacterium]|nr:hypothetical protein [Polyangiaceae bacterium]MCW5790593.1 hypothetical protein [Polyangiaceae bacterium]